MARPFQRISPASGGSRPISMRSRLVLPAPFLPCRYSSSPASSLKPRPANRRRSPRTHSRLSASSIRKKPKEIRRELWTRKCTGRLTIIKQNQAGRAKFGCRHPIAGGGGMGLLKPDALVAHQNFGLDALERFGQLLVDVLEFVAQRCDGCTVACLVLGNQTGADFVHSRVKRRNRVKGFNGHVAFAVGAVLPAREAARVFAERGRLGRASRIIEVGVQGAYPALVVDFGDQHGQVVA